MTKRFTEADKWSDPWFRALRSEFKLAWLYILDNCDPAGVIDIDKPLADFQIGNALDWNSFLTHCDGRIETLSNGKWFVVRFVEFQYGELSTECRAHNPVFASLKRNGVFNRVSKGYPKGIQRVQDKDKDKDKDKELNNTSGWIIPEEFDTPDIRSALGDFEKMRKRIGKPIKDLENTSRILKRFDSPEHLLYAIEFCIGNEYQGLKPDYRPSNRGGGQRQLTFTQQREANMQAAGDRFVAGAPE
jgi:hypothetical protein